MGNEVSTMTQIMMAQHAGDIIRFKENKKDD